MNITIESSSTLTYSTLFAFPPPVHGYPLMFFLPYFTFNQAFSLPAHRIWFIKRYRKESRVERIHPTCVETGATTAGMIFRDLEFVSSRCKFSKFAIECRKSAKNNSE